MRIFMKNAGGWKLESTPFCLSYFFEVSGILIPSRGLFNHGTKFSIASFIASISI